MTAEERLEKYQGRILMPKDSPSGEEEYEYHIPESELKEIMDQHTLSIIEQAVGEEREKYRDSKYTRGDHYRFTATAIRGALNNVEETVRQKLEGGEGVCDKKSLNQIRWDLMKYIDEHPYFPEYMKGEAKNYTTKQFNLIGEFLGQIELTDRRATHTDIKTEGK